MEYGVIRDPSVNWTLIVFAVGCLVAGLLLVIFYRKYMEDRRDDDAISIISAIFFIVLFIATLVLAIAGFAAARSRDLLPAKYASDNGYYRIVDSYLVYYVRNESVKDENDASKSKIIAVPLRPAYFELTLEGRAGKNLPSDVRIVRLFEVPYDMVSQNYRFAPPVPKTDARIKVAAPPFIIKYEGDFWQFSWAAPGEEY